MSGDPDSARLTHREAGRRFYEARVGERRYSAEHDVLSGQWLVHGHVGARLDPYGRTWARVVRACEAAFLATDPHPALRQ